MKISAKKYAQALYDATKHKSEKEIKDGIGRFVKIMDQNKDINKKDLVLKYFQKIWNKEEGISVIDITTANEIDKETEKLISKYAGKLLNAQKILIRKKINREILGGMIVKQEDRIYDFSIQSRINDLKDKLNK